MKKILFAVLGLAMAASLQVSVAVANDDVCTQPPASSSTTTNTTSAVAAVRG